MCKFEIEYECKCGQDRIGVVFAENLDEAVEKIERIDDEFDGVMSVRFKEIPGWRPDFKVEK